MRVLARRAERSLCETAVQALCVSEQRQQTKRAAADPLYVALFCEDLKGRIPRHQSAASHSK